MSQRLEETPVLILDCQATGPNPIRDQLLEVAWTKTSPGCPDEAKVKSFLIEPPADFELSARIQRLTGITTEHLKRGLPASRVAACLAADTLQTATSGSPCPMVIHFARFERRHLETLMRTDSETPKVEVVCTHEIAKRVLPGLPRRSLRAVAGYFGHATAPQRRAEDHVRATLSIWFSCIPLLEEAFGITVWEDLLSWLAESTAPHACGREYPMDPEARLRLTEDPGVYRMCRSNGEVLYVGKAKSLRKRVNSYFQKRAGHPAHILEMLAQTRRVEPTTVGSALEAAVLESDLIKTLSPPYNVALRAREKELVFLSRDLLSLSGSPDPRFPVGPLPNSRGLQIFQLCISQGRSEVGPESAVLPRVLPASPWDTLTIEEFWMGWQEFLRRHSSEIKSWHRAGVMAFGARLWEEGKNRERAEAGQEETRGNELDHGNWSPDKVTRLLDGVFLSATHSMRKARWLCWLSESAVSWTTESGSRGKKHLMRVVSGAPKEFQTLTIEAGLPIPTGYCKSLLARQGSFNLDTYDRMVVLTGELRRLLHEDRKLEVRLGPRTALDAGKLSEILRWV